VLAALAWTALPHHHGDTSPLPDEVATLTALRSLKLPRGNYLFPHAVHGQQNSPEFKAKWKAGPTGMLNIWPAEVSMAKCMVLSFLVYLAVSVLVGYLASVTLLPGAGFAKVFQVAGTAGVLGYGFAHLPNGIWFQAYPRALLACTVDGLVFGLATGAIFAGLWPGA
jgi:hypothetical protein